MYLYAQLFGVFHGSIRQLRVCKGQLAYVKEAVQVRPLGKRRLRPRSRQFKGTYEVARIGIEQRKGDIMRKKINAILTVALLVSILLVTLVSCSQAKADFFDYSEKNLGVVGKLVRLMHQWIGNYGWTVVVFTVFLKLIMLPIDFWQRYSSRKSSVKMQRIQPLLEGIDKRYGANTQRANEEKQKLYKKQGYSMLSTCLPMILSMIIFFVMFGGLREYSTYSTIVTFQDLSTEYYKVLEDEFTADPTLSEIYSQKKAEYAESYRNDPSKQDAKQLSGYEALVEMYARMRAVNDVNGVDSAKGAAADKVAIEKVQQMYLEEKESWLWIKNVWQPDTWETVMPAYDSGANAFLTSIDKDKFYSIDVATTYTKIREAILAVDGYGDNGSWDGLMILPILSVGLSFLSMWLSQFLEKKNRKGTPQAEPSAQNQQQQVTNKMMMIMMPLMMAVFGFMYTGAFAIYMVCNYTLSIISTLALRVPVEKMVEKSLAKSDKKENSGKASYMR